MPTSRIQVVAFDPGERRTGVAAYFGDAAPVSCYSHEPWGAVRFLHLLGGSVKHVVLEQWVPYPNRAAANAWRDLVEVKTLGALEWVCRVNGISYSYQQAKLLTGTQARADADGYEWQATNRDEKAAETHLYYYRFLNPINQERKT